MIEEQQVLALQLFTWQRDSHGLYDYENTTSSTSTLEVNKSLTLVRGKDSVKASTNPNPLKGEERIADIYQSGNSYVMRNSLEYNIPPTEENINSLQNKFWFPVKSLNISPNSFPANRIFNDFRQLQLNDIIKLGRVKYVVTQLNFAKEQNSMDVDIPARKEVIQLFPKVNCTQFSNIDCKICMSNLEEEDNVMVKLCKCTGSIAMAHINCIKLWMNTKLSKKSNEKSTVQSYNIKAFNCEICKLPYPLKFELDGRCHSLIDVCLPGENFMVLESLNQTKDNNNYKSVHVIKFSAGDKVFLGRGHESDIRVNDISVSRKHASLEFSSTGVVLKDLCSKFGTLVLLHDDIQINEDIYLQIGRTFGKFGLEKGKSNQKKQSNLAKSHGFLLNSFEKSEKNSADNFDLSTSKPKLFKVEKVDQRKNDVNK
jgi:hypothetical protein